MVNSGGSVERGNGPRRTEIDSRGNRRAWNSENFVC
jgi:hypothetical protein